MPLDLAGKPNPAWTLDWDADWVTAVCFLGPTRTLAAGNNLGQILLWSLPEDPRAPAPAPHRRLDGHTNTISRLAATPDGRWLISASYDHTIRLWEMPAKVVAKETVVLNATARELRVRRRGGAKPPPPKEVPIEVQKNSVPMTGHRDWVTALALGRDGKRLVSGDDQGQVIVWDVPARREELRWKVRGWVYALALSPDERQVVVSERLPLVFDSGRHAGIKLWERETGQMERDLQGSFKGMHLAAASYSPDGKLLAFGRGGEVDGTNGIITLVDPVTGKLARTLTPGHLNGLTDLAWHPTGRYLASVGRDTVVRLWNPAGGKMVHELGKPRGGQFKDWLHAVAFSADGVWIAAGDMAGAVQVWSWR